MCVCVCLPLSKEVYRRRLQSGNEVRGGRRGAVAMEQLVAAVSASDSSHAMRAMGVHGGRCALPLLCGHVVVYLCDQTGCLFPLAPVIKMWPTHSDDVARGRACVSGGKWWGSVMGWILACANLSLS
jgi:hypothetical protein